MHLFAEISASATTSTWVLLFIAVGLALTFEFVNGFHDTANAVATVIYTRALPANVAVIWSGLCNLLGVWLSAGTVAYGIIALLPQDLVLNVGSSGGFAMVFALLISAILWNLGTWYLGLPASSSHTMIGSILGVGVAHALMTGHPWTDGMNWTQVIKVVKALLISPIVGFVLSALLLVVAKMLIKNKALFSEPVKDKAPPIGIRSLLILTCTGVSYSHGSNDGQKGMGLLVLILVAIMPGAWALNLHTSQTDIHAIVNQSQAVRQVFAAKAAGVPEKDEAAAVKELTQFESKAGIASVDTFGAIAGVSKAIGEKLSAVKDFNELPEADRSALRKEFYLVSDSIEKLDKGGKLATAESSIAKPFAKQLKSVTQYIPPWVKIAVALALGLGTMIGWKRIVVTVGEKIGKSHLTYGQGAAAELVAWGTIQAADNFGLPVSTTHILSSGVAGTMAANGSGLQAQTLRNILLAWVLTLPVCIFMGSLLFALGSYLVLHFFGVQ